jgi:hypothetical protein
MLAVLTDSDYAFTRVHYFALWATKRLNEL